MGTLPHILVVDDDSDLQDYLKTLLSESNFVVNTASSGSEALKSVQKIEPDLVLLDLMLPDMNGEGVCKEIKKLYPECPVVMLTAKDEVASKVRGLEGGADDYITKPFEPEELVARVKARLRGAHGEDTILKIADLELNKKTIEVTRAGKVIPLTPQEFKLLEYLMTNKNIVLTRDMILNRIWLYSPDIESRVVDVYVGYLRKKIDSGHKRKLITSIRGFGYTIKET
jgi:two-component system response regulator MprA